MAAIKRKPGAKSVLMETETMRSTADALEESIGAFSEKLDTLTPGATCDQSIMEVALMFHRIQEAAKKSYELFSEAAKVHKEKGGKFSLGRIAITFPERTERRPKWKEEAVKVAGELATVRGEGFSEEVFVQEVQAQYPATTSVSVKLVESEG
jgi:hypothetical protein